MSEQLEFRHLSSALELLPIQQYQLKTSIDVGYKTGLYKLPLLMYIQPLKNIGLG